jgi:hypothetical protein
MTSLTRLTFVVSGKGTAMTTINHSRLYSVGGCANPVPRDGSVLMVGIARSAGRAVVS